MPSTVIPLIDPNPGEISKLRMLLAINHGCGCVQMYVDDGELQCPICHVDFKRDPVAMIQEKFNALAEKRMKEFAQSSEGRQWTSQQDRAKDQISDGFGSTWSAWCRKCNTKTMHVVRPGEARCDKCDN